MSPAGGIQFGHVRFLNESVSGSSATGTALYAQLVRIRYESRFPQEPARKRFVLLILAYQDVVHPSASRHRSHPRAIS